MSVQAAEKLTTIAFRCEKDLKKAARVYGAQNDISIEQMCNEALRAYLAEKGAA